MEKNTGKVREKSGNFVIPEKWEPCNTVGKRAVGHLTEMPSCSVSNRHVHVNCKYGNVAFIVMNETM